MYNFTVFYTCRYIYLFIFFIIINCDMSHVLEINYLILSYLIYIYIYIYIYIQYICYFNYYYLLVSDMLTVVVDRKQHEKCNTF